jgi:membrane protein implicated in regulation of membrane protease activity
VIPLLGPVEFWHWWALGGVLAIVEAFVPGFVFLWLGIAAGLVGCVLWLWPPLGPDYQVLLFAGLSVASVLGWRRWQQAHPGASEQPNLNRRGAQYVGRQSTLVEPIVNGRGRIRLGDASWAVTGPDLPAGATVEVVGADGVVLQVRPLAGAEDATPSGHARSGDVAVDCPGCFPTEP